MDYPMEKEIEELEDWCKTTWGVSFRDPTLLIASGTKQIRKNFDFNSFTPKLKCHLAEKLILESCSHLGQLISSGDDHWFIYNFAQELKWNAFNRETQPLKAALILLAHVDYGATSPDKRSDYDHICAGGGAMVAMYLLAHLESLFRSFGQYLNYDGSFKQQYLKTSGSGNDLPLELIQYASIQPRWKRIDRIEKAFKLFLYKNETPIGRRMQLLEKTLTISTRLERMRNPVMHGELEDPSSEAMFYGLLTAFFYYEC
jgi:hypothetical protein